MLSPPVQGGSFSREIIYSHIDKIDIEIQEYLNKVSNLAPYYYSLVHRYKLQVMNQYFKKDNDMIQNSGIIRLLTLLERGHNLEVIFRFIYSTDEMNSIIAFRTDQNDFIDLHNNAFSLEKQLDDLHSEDSFYYDENVSDALRFMYDRSLQRLHNKSDEIFNKIYIRDIFTYTNRIFNFYNHDNFTYGLCSICPIYRRNNMVVSIKDHLIELPEHVTEVVHLQSVFTFIKRYVNIYFNESYICDDLIHLMFIYLGVYY